MRAAMMKFCVVRLGLCRAVTLLLVAAPPVLAHPAAAPILPPSQLDQLLAPIALYSDPLVAQILMASTYPLEVIDATRWLKDPANAALSGDQLVAALRQQGWDGSVKSLVPFPQVVEMMDYRLDWTQNLGNAFLAQQGDVMDSVQRLRHRAQAARHLSSGPEEVVSSQGGAIVIEPASSGMLFVPAYDPTIVFGYWPYPGQPPVSFPPWPGTVLVGGFSFGAGLSILAPFWGWDGPDWGHRNIHIDSARYNQINHDHPSIAGGVWQHDANHRQAVPYRGATVRARYDAARMSAPRAALDVRGYELPSPPPQTAAPRAPASVFEGVERGSAIHVDAARGHASRQVAAPARTQPPAHQQATFASPEPAVEALLAAMRSGNAADMIGILGPRGEDVISSGDAVADRNAADKFIAAYGEMNKIVLMGKDRSRAQLRLGADEWPFTVPLVKVGAVWRFDSAAGLAEILDRRIGRNELNAIEVCRTYVEAQNEYADADRLTGGLLEYAQKIRSTPGSRDGLYWPVAADEEKSPLGPLVASARAEGYDKAGDGRPYHGYRYKILTRQGKAAIGGARDYVAKGHMIGGFALLAFPARYGDSGVMTFIVSHDGVVYQKNLGPETAAVASAISEFNPDQGWMKQ